MTTAPFDILGIVCALAIAGLVLHVVRRARWHRYQFESAMGLLKKTQLREAEANTRANQLEQIIKDDCETDSAVRDLARPVLGNLGVDGDSYAVPPLEDITAALVARTSWQVVHVSASGRGPNADAWYWLSPPHQGARIALTDEAVVAAKVRGNHVLTIPHTITDSL